MDEVLKNLVGSRVRKRRLELDITQDAFAARCQTSGWDLSRGTFSKIEAGLRRVNDAEVVLLAKILKCPVAELLEGYAEGAVIAVARNGNTA